MGRKPQPSPGEPMKRHSGVHCPAHPRPHRGDPQGPTREVQYPAGPATNPAPRVDMRTITKTTRRVPKQRRRSRTCRNPSRDPGGRETIAAMEHPTGQRPTREDPTIRPAPTTGGPRCMDNMNHEALQDIGSLYEKETGHRRRGHTGTDQREQRRKLGRLVASRPSIMT